MNFDNPTIQTIAIVGGILAYLGYKFFGEGKNKAEEVTTATYRQLNEALEKKITAMDTDLKIALGRVTDLETRVTNLTAEKLNIENLLVRALREFFASNPKGATELAEKFGVK